METPPVIRKQDFLVLSASINYQLTGEPVHWRAMLALVFENRRPPSEALLIDVLDYLHRAYGGSKRRLGPFAVIHPIRAGALLCRAAPELATEDLVTAFLHDKLEDIRPERHDPRRWARLEADYRAVLAALDPAWHVDRRIYLLTRQPNDTYYAYLGRLLDSAGELPELVHVKLADRLDNTLDMSIDLQTEISTIDGFEYLFDVLFTDVRPGQGREFRHPPPRKMNGAQRLYQLFKNVVFLSMLRQRRLDCVDPAAERLFDTLAQASLDEARAILVHLFVYHLTSRDEQRALLEEAMAYCQQGEIARITPPGSGHVLDGLFTTRFDHRERRVRKQKLAELYQDKRLMSLAALAFSSIFSSFLHDPAFFVEGIDERGIHPHA